MSASANVQPGSGRSAMTDQATPPSKLLATTNPRDKARSAAAPAADTAARCSPDPCQHTDRYRLVTPFSLRL